MKDLGITKQTHLLHGDCFKNEYDFYTQPVSSTKSGTILFANAYGKTEKEAKANAKLIANAGTTANKCGLLPSELLEQRDELVNLLERFLYHNMMSIAADQEANKLIQKITKQ